MSRLLEIKKEIIQACKEKIVSSGYYNFKRLAAVKNMPRFFQMFADYMDNSVFDKLSAQDKNDLLSIFIKGLSNAINLSHHDTTIFKKFYQYLENKPLGSWSEAFIDAALGWISSESEDGNYFYIDKEYMLLRAKCDQYAKASLPEKKKDFLENIEVILTEFRAKSYPKFHHEIPVGFLRRVYLFEDESLTKLFSRYLPIPRIDYFEENTAPLFISNREKQINGSIRSFISRNNKEDFPTLEKKVAQIQRFYRAKKRQRTELLRIPERFPGKFKTDEIKDLIPTSSTPYFPQGCSESLARRIFNMTWKIKFIDEIRHETRSSALKSIFDSGLYGHDTLLQLLINFEGATLHSCDVEDGDGNVICFTAGHGLVDPDAYSNIELIFDFDELNFGPNKSLHCAFFKQQDFGFCHNAVRDVNVGEGGRISFSHTRSTKCSTRGYTYLHLAYQSRETHKKIRKFDVYSGLPNIELISYDINHIDQVLILNFFKFLDKLHPKTDHCGHASVSPVISKIYSDIDKMGDEELRNFLRDVGLKLSDTMEFNFYGAQKIDFDALSKIKTKGADSYCLNMQEFIHELQDGKLDIFMRAKEKIPTAFESYRFLDFLATKTNDNTVLSELSKLRVLCEAPEWYPNEASLGAVTRGSMEGSPRLSSF